MVCEPGGKNKCGFAFGKNDNRLGQSSSASVRNVGKFSLFNSTYSHGPIVVSTVPS